MVKMTTIFKCSMIGNYSSCHCVGKARGCYVKDATSVSGPHNVGETSDDRNKDRNPPKTTRRLAQRKNIQTKQHMMSSSKH